MLTGPEIERQIALGRIVIDPFDPKRVNPNSVNLRLSKYLLCYDLMKQFGVLDMAKENATYEIEIPPEGYELEPGKLYLGSTMEYTESPHHIPMLEGRSSVGRLGLAVHITAGFGDQNFSGTWTLELVSIYRLRVYAGAEICQIAYTDPVGENKPYAGKYQGQGKPQPSSLWKEFLRSSQ